VILTAKDR